MSLPDLDTRCDFEIDSDEDRLTQSDYVDLLYEEDQKEKFFQSIASKHLKEFQRETQAGESNQIGNLN